MKKKEKVNWQRLIWTSLVVPKHAVISWMAILNILPTKDRMWNWGIELDEDCILCKEEKESREHMFFACRFSKTI